MNRLIREHARTRYLHPGAEKQAKLGINFRRAASRAHGLMRRGLISESDEHILRCAELPRTNMREVATSSSDAYRHPEEFAENNFATIFDLEVHRKSPPKASDGRAGKGGNNALVDLPLAMKHGVAVGRGVSMRCSIVWRRAERGAQGSTAPIFISRS